MNIFRRPFGYGRTPTVAQVLLAAVLGILLGLIYTKVLEERQTRKAFKKEAMLEQLQQASKDFTETAKKITIVPTLGQRMNVLLMGVDSNGRGTKRWVNTRSDTMVIVSLDPERKKVGMVSIPRDSRVTIGTHGADKINAAHAFGGPELAVETVKENFNVPIDHYVVIDAQGLRKVFEALGPIEVVVEKKMHYNDWAGHLHVALEPGVHMLSPEQAEEYVRFRHDPRGDIGRIERQQWFLRQLTNKFREPQVLLKLPELFKIANEYVVTDLSPEDMAKIANFGRDIKPNEVTSGTVPGRATLINGGSYWEPDYTGAAVVFNRLLGTPMNSPGPEIAEAASNSAYAATGTPGADRPTTINIKYPKGAEKIASAFEMALTDAGYKVKYKIRADAADCTHEQIVQTSMRADDLLTEKLQTGVQKLSPFPVVVNFEEHAPADFTIILASTSVPPEEQMKKVEEKGNVDPFSSTSLAEKDPQQAVTIHHRRRARHHA